MIRRLSILALVAVSLLAMATTASAAYFTAPDWVIAQENGHFIVAMAVYTGSGGALTVDAEALLGTINCSEDRRREQGCNVAIPGFDEYHFIYEGNLTDASIDGVVELSIEFCEDHAPLVATINVLNSSTVATEEGSWSSLKAQYR